jgi:Cdc6-like AAA superfamily ATPase
MASEHNDLSSVTIVLVVDDLQHMIYKSEFRDELLSKIMKIKHRYLRIIFSWVM